MNYLSVFSFKKQKVILFLVLFGLINFVQMILNLGLIKQHDQNLNIGIPFGYVDRVCKEEFPEGTFEAIGEDPSIDFFPETVCKVSFTGYTFIIDIIFWYILVSFGNFLASKKVANNKAA